MSNAPAFQFYAHDFLAGRVATYSLDEIGAYSLLLAFEWSLSGLPVEPENLAKLCRISLRKFRVVWAKIGDQFVERDGRLYHPKLDKERQKHELWRAKSVEGGKKSAEKRAKGGSTVVQPPHQPPYGENGQPKGNIATPIPTPVTTRSKEESALRADPPELEAPVELEGVEQVITHYKALHPLRRPGKADERLVARRLEHHTPDELCEALDGNAADEWHCERRKHELSYVLRNVGKIDEFRAIAQAQAPRLAVDPETGLPNAIGLAVLRGGRAA